MNRFDFGAHKVELCQELFDFFCQLAHLRSRRMTAAILTTRREIAPELYTIRVLQTGDFYGERIDVLRDFIAEEILRRCVEDATEREKEAEIESLFVSFDA